MKLENFKLEEIMVGIANIYGGEPPVTFSICYKNTEPNDSYSCGDTQKNCSNDNGFTYFSETLDAGCA